MILSGDVGGTKTRLALFEEQNGRLQRRQMATYASQDFSHLEDIVKLFLEETNSQPRIACLGVPGPIRNGKASMTNLPWSLDEKSIASAGNFASFKLVNDLEAITTAIPFLKEDDLTVLYAGSGTVARGETCAVLAPGTGLGQAYLTWQDGIPQAHPSEGGHVDFAPSNEIGDDLLAYLRKRFGRVSYERVLCGPGLINIFDFLQETNFADIPQKLHDKLKSEDPAAVIANAGQTGEFEICTKALDMFVSLLGSQAGNYVLSLMATGGVYLGGGIPIKIKQKLLDGTFLKAYLHKGRLSNIVEATPVSIINDDTIALLGSAHLALQNM